MKKILATAVAASMAISAVPAMAAELVSGAGTYPMNSDKTITWYARDSHNVHSDYADWKESPFHVNLSKMLGINVEWILPTTGANGSQFTNTLMADPSTLPNIHIVFLMVLPSAFLFGRYPVAVGIQVIDQTAFRCPGSIFPDGAHGQQNVNVRIAITLVMNAVRSASFSVLKRTVIAWILTGPPAFDSTAAPAPGTRSPWHWRRYRSQW